MNGDQVRNPTATGAVKIELHVRNGIVPPVINFACWLNVRQMRQDHDVALLRRMTKERVRTNLSLDLRAQFPLP